MKRLVTAGRKVMPSRKRCLVLLATLAFVAFAGCGKQLTALSEVVKLQRQITSKYREDGVHVNLNNDRYLTVTFINSPLNSKSSEERGTRAQETAAFVVQHYPSIGKLDELWVVFMRQETRYVVATYSDTVEYFGFDRSAHPLPKREEVQPVRRTESRTESPAHPTAIYSPGRQETDIFISRLQLEGDSSSGLSVSPHFAVAGDVSGVRRSSSAPGSVGLDFASYSSIQMFSARESRITFLTDGEVVYETTETFTSSRSPEGGYSQFLMLQVPYPAFRKMTTGKKLILRIGDREYNVADEQLAALHEMTAYVRK
jgi:hypothetical protein